MKRISLVLSIVVVLFTSCAVYRVEASRIETDTIYGEVCENPTYVATIALEPDATFDAYGNRITTGNYTLKDCLDAAQEKFGNEVTIVNVRWDIKNKGKRKSAIFDVIRCK